MEDKGTPGGGDDARRVEVKGIGGTVSIASNIAPGRGCGSSTSDVAAAVRATLRALGRSVSSEGIARLAVAAEGASDATFWDRPVLFAQRHGHVIEDYKSPLPPLEVLAFETAPGGAGIDTLALPAPRYVEREIRTFEELRTSLRLALERSDARGVAVVATRSALLNQRYLPQPGLEEVAELARRVGAIGIQVAHSGEVGGCCSSPARASSGASGGAPGARGDGSAAVAVQSAGAGRRRAGRSEPAGDLAIRGSRSS